MDQGQIAYGIELGLMPLRDALTAVNEDSREGLTVCRAQGREGTLEGQGKPQRGEQRRRVETPEFQPACSSPGWSLP